MLICEKEEMAPVFGKKPVIDRNMTKDVFHDHVQILYKKAGIVEGTFDYKMAETKISKELLTYEEAQEFCSALP